MVIEAYTQVEWLDPASHSNLGMGWSVSVFHINVYLNCTMCRDADKDGAGGSGGLYLLTSLVVLRGADMREQVVELLTMVGWVLLTLTS